MLECLAKLQKFRNHSSLHTITFYKYKIKFLFIASSIWEFCTPAFPCPENQGDCDFHNECQNYSACGHNNCPASLVGYDPGVDCCYKPSKGDLGFCTKSYPCNENEGDCDKDEDCESGLFCGIDNCPESLGYNSEVDCCSTTQWREGLKNSNTSIYPESTRLQIVYMLFYK